MISDGIGLGDDGKIASIAPKITILPLLNAAIGIRGDALIALLLMSGLSADWQQFGSYDGLRSGLVDHLSNVFDVAGDQWEAMRGPGWSEMDIIVAGWSETSGPDSYLLRTMEGTATPAWEIIDTGGVLLTPSNDGIFESLGEFGRSGAISDLEMIAIAEKQRNYTEPYGPNKIETSLVGGFLQLTTITERDISTRIIHRWNDRIGEPICQADAR